ncbi:MAG: tail fiber domain-containing protein [Bacteroidales bacterium]|nr:tail fiber domain-containing protein [Bacteroidales bacterium]
MRVNASLSKLISTLLMLLLQTGAFSQVPQGISYQAVIRDGSGKPIASKIIGVRITLENASGTAYYIETQTPTSSGEGLITLNIGGGTKVGVNTFSSIPWMNGDVYIKLEIDPAGGNAYTSMGNHTQLQSVPYALYAENAKEIVSAPTALDSDPIFEVKNKSGQVVFGVYQGGVRVYVEDTQIKGAKGGFAVGGLSNQAKAGQAEYFRITPDSARVWVKEVPTVKGAKGGFAVGGLSNQAKTVVSRNMMFVAPDSARIYVNQSVAKNAKGGFAVGGLSNQAKGSTDQFLQLTSDNYLIGYQAGRGLTTGLYNSFMGYQSGQATTIGSSNVFLGFQSGFTNTTGTSNVFIGYLAGYNNNASYNSFIGYQAGKANTTGQYNAFMGYNAGKSNTIGSSNVFIGNQSGTNSTSGSSNVFIGDSVGTANTSGDKNVFLGNFAGKSNVFGADNIYIGYQSGYMGLYGGQNICIGDYSGYNNTTSQNLFIGEYAGEKNTSGSRNSFVGFFAGQDNQTGQLNSYFGQFAGMNNTQSYNTFIGYWAGGSNVNGEKDTYLGWRAGQGSSGSNNVFLGYQAGEGNTGGSNVLIGYQAGYYTGNKSNALYIANSSTATPLIGGDFSTARVGINRMPTTYTLEVGGTIWANGSTISAGASTWSDSRFKTNIVTLTNALFNVCNLRGVTYDWDNTNKNTSNFPKGKQIGVIAQEVEKIFPELVITGDDGYKSVAYEKMSAIFIEAFKEQQLQIKNQQTEIETLKAEIEAIKTLLKK